MGHVELLQAHKASLRVFQISMVNNDLLLHLASFDASLMVFGDIFSILYVWSLSWSLKKLDLWRIKAELAMLMSAPECEKQSIHERHDVYQGLRVCIS